MPTPTVICFLGPNLTVSYTDSLLPVANNFTLYDYKNPAASANSPAVVDCGKSGKCTSPTFKLNRTLIELPIIQQNADVTHTQVASGECKIVSDPVEGELLYPPTQSGTYGPSNATMTALFNAAANRTELLNQGNFTNATSGGNRTNPFGSPTSAIRMNNGTGVANQTLTIPPPLRGPWNMPPGKPTNLTGKAISIACNLTADIPDILSPTYDTSRASFYPLANSSTNGDESFFVPPPSPNPFKPLTRQSGVCLYSSKATQTLLCLPNGTFPTCQGAFGFSTSSMDSVSFFNTGANLTLNLIQMINSDGEDVTPYTFFDNTTAVGDLKYPLSVATSQKDSFEVVIPRDVESPPAMCIYSAAEFKGDVWCMGPGGTNFTSNLVNKAASLSLTDGLAAWLYPSYYGNPLGMQISTNVADLTEIPYLTDQSFKGNLAAAWIYNASAVKD